MKKSDIASLPQFFDTYINLVNDLDLIDGLQSSLTLFDPFLENLELIGNLSYEKEKWTTKEVIQHITDNERIQSYRAMRIARNDKTILPGYDEVLLGKNSNANQQEMKDLIAEFKLLRKSNILLFKSFNSEMLQRVGICFQVEISPLALGFVLIGHQMHHLQVLKDKYLPLMN